jgi:inhibitor of cysteine peptidase
MKKFIFPVLTALLAAFFLSGNPLTATGTSAETETNSIGTSTNTGADRLKSAVVMYVGSPTAKVMGKTVRIDALNMKVRPINKDSLVYVPARFVVESLGGSSSWDGGGKTATFTLGGDIIELTPFGNSMSVNGKQVKLSVPVEAEYGRILAPLDAFAEALGRQVFSDGGLIVISDTEELFDARADGAFLDELAADISQPPAVGSQAGLKELLGQIKDLNGDRYYVKSKENMLAADTANKTVAVASETRSAVPQEPSDDGFAGGSDYSGTNIQVEGVDEADVVKTDGEYIYQVNGKRIIIARAYPAEALELASVISFSDAGFSPQELYVDGKYLAVIGSSRAKVPVKGNNGKNDASYPGVSINTVRTIIYDISDKKNVRVIRETELDGSYISSRKIGDRLYLLANRDIGGTVFSREWQQPYLKGDYSEALSEGYSREFIDNALAITEKPVYRDTAAGEAFTGIPYDRLHYFPDSIQPNYLVIASLDIAKPGEKADISAYLGSGSNIYASLQNMYVSFTDYESYNILNRKSILLPERNYNTIVYKFSLEDGIVRYRSKGTVPGSVLNQFSMDEYNGFFRIATTSGNLWGTGEAVSKNNVYILDNTMGIAGRVEDMAPGERIYSVRFAGDRGYVVTFRKVDPLFVLDLKNAASPQVLGSLKIPGYSDYLQPYDENHILGFGKETVEIKGQAYYQGMKMAMFDVTDVTKPVRKFSVNIGDRGTESELLSNHKALLFSRSKELIAFPVTLYEVKDRGVPGAQDQDVLQYGSFAFQGAYVYRVNPDTGFELRGRITHLTEEDYLKAGDNWRKSGRDVDRILYISDTLYTLSQEEIRANGLDDLKKVGSLAIP